ncbi:MAG: chalcone isomerase family protein [Marinicellaceae bacterium]
MIKKLHLLILLLTLIVSNASIAEKNIQWVEIGEGTYDHGFIFPYKIKLFIPFGVRSIEDLKEGLLPMRFKLKWLPIELSKKKVKGIFYTQLKDNFNNMEGFKLSSNIIEQFLKQLPKIKKHDQWVFDYYPDEGTKFYLKDKKIYHLVGAEINRALIQSWVNKNPMLTSNLFNRLLKVQ